MSGLGPRYRQSARVEQAELNQHRSLVPVNMLVYQLVALELDDGHRGDFHGPTGRRNSRQHPIDHRGMREVDDEFVHDRVRANRAANRRQTEVRRIDRYEMEGVETLQLFV